MIKYYLILILGILIYSCSIKPTSVKITEPIKEWRDTILYSIVDFDGREDEWIEINYTLDKKYDLEEEYEIKIHQKNSCKIGFISTPLWGRRLSKVSGNASYG